MSEIEWAEESDLSMGQQVVYVPRHAGDDLDHPDCERGFVTKVDGGYAWVRYFYQAYVYRNQPLRLRTWANSEMTPVCALVVKDFVSQGKITRLLITLGYLAD